VLLPLLALGSEAAHAILGIFAPPGFQGAELAEFSGEGARQLPLVVAVAAALVVGGLLAAPSGRRSPRASRFVVAALPLVAFTVQEHVEYALGHGHVAWALGLRPAFALGLALQLPFALLAYILAGLLLVLADAVATRLVVAAGRPRLDLHPVLAAAPGATRPRRARPSGDARFNRGPPQPMFV